jgi:hypothetical protein
MLLALLIEDMMANDNNFSKNVFEEIDEMFKGIAVNGQGIGIDFEEIRKAESMYDKEKESK